MGHESSSFFLFCLRPQSLWWSVLLHVKCSKPSGTFSHFPIVSKFNRYSPKEVCPAVQFAIPEETFLREVTCAVWALHTGSVPGPVKDVQEEPVQDGPLAASALDHHGWGAGFQANLAGRNGWADGWTIQSGRWLTTSGHSSGKGEPLTPVKGPQAFRVVLKSKRSVLCTKFIHKTW